MNSSGEDNPELNEILESNTRENTGTNEQWNTRENTGTNESKENQTIELPSSRLKTSSVKLACFQQVEDKLCGVSLLPAD